MTEEMITIQCKDCGVTFDVSAEEQKWYEQKGFELPKRCHRCRRARRNSNNSKNRKQG